MADGGAVAENKPFSVRRTASDRALKVIDFLNLPLVDAQSVSRKNNQFRLERAWSLARFGEHLLDRGWWLLECESDEHLRKMEVRLTSSRNPLITLSNDNGGLASGVRIYLPQPEAFDMSVLLSPWPGVVRFKKLRLRCLSSSETIKMFASGVRRLVETENRVRKLAHIGRQFVRGRPIGWRVDSSGPPRAETIVSTGEFKTNVRQHALRLVRHEEFDVFLGSEDSLDPRAAEIVVQEFRRAPNLHAIYCDVVEGDTIRPRLERDAELGHWFEVATPPLFFRRDSHGERRDLRQRLNAVIKTGGPESIARVPLPLVRRPERSSPVLPAVPTPVLKQSPKVSIIIPTKYRIELLERCLDGLANSTSYRNFEVIVVDNGSRDRRLPGVLERARSTLELIHIKMDGKFNFSRLVNAGVDAASGSVVLLMNDDIEPIHEDWLHRIVESVLLPDVGAVGARLVYPDRSIQHAGVSLGIGGICGHLWKGLSEQEASRLPYIVYPGERLAVTGACLAIRRDLFKRVGGFDDVSLPVALNDVDFCLRVRELGFRNIYRGDAVLIHRESQSRGHDSQSSQKLRRAEKETAVFLSRWRNLLGSDPFSSPQFDPRTESGAVHHTVLAGDE